MKVSGSIAALALIVAFGAANAAGSAQPAVWSPHVLIIDLHNLPRRYTCDELWYKFRDVLVAIGARPDLKILPYRCERGLGSIANSPRVQLEFSLPHVVGGKEATLATVHVHTESIRLEPGAPGHLDNADCALLNQIRGTLLRSIGSDVTDFRLNCQALTAAEPAFDLTVRADVPVTQPAAVVAGAQRPRKSELAGSGS